VKTGKTKKLSIFVKLEFAKSSWKKF